MRREVNLSLMLAIFSGGTVALMSYDMFRPTPPAQPAASPAPVAQISLTTVVVAKGVLEFGTQLTKFKVSEAQWPVASVPSGAYRSIREMFNEQSNRSVLVKINDGEPVLRDKVTGPGKRAGLSALLLDGKKAISVRVNDVLGVGGFVLPGDRVDILLTRKERLERPDGFEDRSFTDILLQNVRVLAIDQTADSKLETPTVARTVTVEATLQEAQKLTLAGTVGELSLVLREEGKATYSSDVRRVTLADLAGDSGDKDAPATLQPTMAVAPAPEPVPPAPTGPPEATIRVVRSAVSADYTVRRTVPGK